MALTLEEKFNCLGCSSNDHNIYVDDVLQTLITFLNAATCLPWIRSHENIDRPDILETGENQGQYGVVEIIQSTRIHTKRPVLSSDTTVHDNSAGNLDCFEIYSEREIIVQLDIYRENGEANRNQFDATTVQPVGAGMDHLERLIDIYQVPRIKEPLLKKGITINNFSAIDWNKEIVNEVWENIGQMQITLRVCATSSISQGVIKCIYLQMCGHDEQQICEKFEPDCN